MTARLGATTAAFAAAAGLLFAATSPAQSAFPDRGPARERSEARSETREEGRSNPRLGAIALSIVLPGAAHLRMGETGRGAGFLAAEAGLWTAFAVGRVQGSLRKDSYVEMAHLYAGVERPEGRSETYYRRIGNWPSSDSYNRVILFQARYLYRDDLEGREAYFQAHRVASDEAWAWESQSAWDRYRDKRKDSRRAYRRARNMVGLAAANRVVAMLDAALLSGPSRGERAVRLEMAPGVEPASAELRLSWPLP